MTLSDDRIIVTVHPELGDYLRAKRILMANDDTHKKLHTGLIIALIGILSYFTLDFLHWLFFRTYYNLGQFGLSSKHYFLLVLVTIYIGFVILAEVLPLFSIWLAFRRNPQHVLAPVEWLVENKGITCKGKNFTVEYQWEFFPQGLESSQGFLLISSNDGCSIIPKKAFQSDNEISTFRQILKNNLVKFETNLKK